MSGDTGGTKYAAAFAKKVLSEFSAGCQVGLSKDFVLMAFSYGDEVLVDFRCNFGVGSKGLGE